MRTDTPGVHTTNYTNTLITPSRDTHASAATPPPTGTGSVAERQFELLAGHDYELTSDDVLFTVFADRRDIPEESQPRAREEFFGKGQACLRTSPLAKRYGWAFHFDHDGRVALVPMGSQAYDDLMADDGVHKTEAMRSKR